MIYTGFSDNSILKSMEISSSVSFAKFEPLRPATCGCSNQFQMLDRRHPGRRQDAAVPEPGKGENQQAYSDRSQWPSICRPDAHEPMWRRV